MKTLILSSTRCDLDYNADCDYIAMLLDEADARNLLALVDRLKEFQIQDHPKVQVYDITVTNFVPIKVASSLESLKEFPDAELDVVESGNDEVAVCNAEGVEQRFDAIPENPGLFNTVVYLVIREDAITVEARPKHLDVSVYSHGIPLQVIRQIAGEPVAA